MHYFRQNIYIDSGPFYRHLVGNTKRCLTNYWHYQSTQIQIRTTIRIRPFLYYFLTNNYTSNYNILLWLILHISPPDHTLGQQSFWARLLFFAFCSWVLGEGLLLILLSKRLVFWVGVQLGHFSIFLIFAIIFFIYTFFFFYFLFSTPLFFISTLYFLFFF